MAKTYVVTFRSHNGDRASKFIVVAKDRKQAINIAWEHGGADFQSRFDKSTGEAQEMKEGAAGFVMEDLWAVLLILVVAALLWIVSVFVNH